MKIDKICKSVSVVIFILGFIGSIIIAANISYDGFNLLAFIIGIISEFIFCLPLYALGEILERIENLDSKVDRFFYSTKNLLSDKKTEPVNTTTRSIYPSVKTTDGGWICNKCSTKNDLGIQYCKNCGEYK